MEICIMFKGPGLCGVYNKMRDCSECSYYLSKDHDQDTVAPSSTEEETNSNE
jgi:hypothetical protein